MDRSKLTAALFALGLAAAGCAHQPPRELVDARAAYQRAATGPAREDNPAQLHTAQKSLVLAEQTFAEEGASRRARDRAYVAQRKAQLAEVQAQVAANERRLAALAQNMSAQQREELTRLRGDYAAQRQALASQQREFESAERARQDAERRAEQASAELARVATVKQEARGMVITLSGEVLFASNKAELLPSARTKLDEVAGALAEASPEATIVVEGHTDSQGSQAFNLDLSARRAQAVRNYLALHGVAPERIRAEGVGFSRPLADNETAEGRANNRRVEIVVQPQRPGATQTPSPAAPPEG